MKDRPLLPEFLRAPWWLSAVHALPQALLALCLWRAWGLVSGELAPAGRGAYLTLACMQAGLVATAVGASFALRFRGLRVRWPVALAFLAIDVGFLWSAIALSDDLVPRTVADWMLSQPQLVFAMLCLVAPALFYCCLCVAGQTLRLTAAADIGASAAALVLVPAAWYIFAVLGHRFFSAIDLPFAAGLSLFILSTALVLFAFLRLLMRLYRAARGTLLPALLAGLVLPFGGLALNSAIPFPVNLQYWPVYVLTGLNAAVLLLPFRGGRASRLAVWCARAVMFPFTLYFFLIFLPFLPLSILAMIAAGAGFLILAPTFLFVVHARMLFDEARVLARSLPRARLAVLLLAALSLFPLCYAGRAALHRTALMRAVDAVYAPELADNRSAVSPAITRVALKRLQAMKEGLYLPFLSEVYNRIAFDGMVLPDHKVRQISEIVCGEDLTRGTSTPRGRLDPFADLFTTGTRNRGRSWTNTRPPPRDVRLQALRLAAAVTNGPLVTARVELDLLNGAQDAAEYVVDIEIPPWVAVSGFELQMQGAWVPGQMVDRKAAMWVYHMIRDTTRRDPGLLVYTSPRRLRLNVYPFAASETRHAAIEFTVPSGNEAELAFGDRSLLLERAGASEPPVVIVPLAEGGSSVHVPRAVASRLPAHARPLAVHFLLDASTAAVESLPACVGRVSAFLDRHPWMTNTAATAVNFASIPLCPVGTSPSDLRRELSRQVPDVRAQGGYWPDAAIRRELHRELTASAPADHATLFVQVAGTNALDVEALDAWFELLPDVRVVTDRESVPDAGVPVVEVRSRDAWALLAPDSGGWVAGGDDAATAVFHIRTGGQDVALEPGLRTSPDSILSAVASLRRLAALQTLHPPRAGELRDDILRLSRERGILAPGTAYIAVETAAQRVMLDRAEKQSLSAHEAMEFDEFKTPEPSVWIILAGFAAWSVFRARRPRTTNRRSPSRRIDVSMPP